MVASLEKQRGLKIIQNYFVFFIKVKLHKIIAIIIKIYLHFLNLRDENNPLYKKIAKSKNWVNDMTFK